ncbi:PAS domain S-box protein [Flavobacterium rivuli]|uniref:PAS domain S-box protein n=1 Tax=Flavobacterium rivuli TaxID=498301 RepID=UPI00038018F4|nr:PAS domain S-box protein [Flavobacterium rivuli]
MSNFTFSFNEENFSQIFPFYILLDNTLTIQSQGKSLSKFHSKLLPGAKLDDHFRVKRPYIDEFTADCVVEILNQLTILECNTQPDVVLRGQFEIMDGKFLFVGSPWLSSVEEVKQRNLNIFDFANYDPQLDLLQILRKQELTTLEFKEQLKINTEQKEELKRDREELNRLSLVASNNDNAIIFTHPNAEIFWCNDAYVKLTGFTIEEIIGKTPVEIGRTHLTDDEALTEMVGHFYKGESFDVEIAHGKKDGSYFWTRAQGQPIYDENGKVVQYFAMIQDMTDEKEREEQLVILSLIAQKNMNAVIICNSDGTTEWVNPSLNLLTGYSNKELIGINPSTLLSGPDTNPETLAYVYDQLSKGEPFNCEIVNYHKSGRKYWIRVQGQGLYNANGELTRFFAIEEDITNKKSLEEQKEELLRSLEKSNRELEDYAQIVSHDLKSPLRSINSLIAWIKEENEGNLAESTLEYFGMIDNKLEKMEHLIQGVLTYSKIDKTDIAKENVDTHEIISNIISMIHIPANILVSINGPLPVIRADRFRTQQLFQNLISNAVAYIDKTEGYVEVGAKETDDAVTFYVSDNGMGIAKENHEKVFKIFQSLAKNEKSTGLGLSIVKKIIENYKGKIWIESEKGKGTTFYVEIPK